MTSNRSGTENRQRQQLIATRMTDEEAQQVREIAAAQGISVSELLRTRALTPSH